MARKMKDSGIEWIGQIPEDWGTTKLLFALDRPITDGPHETPSYVEEGVPFITINNIDELGNIDKENSNKISAKDALMYNKKAKMKIGDLLFSKSATIGKIAEVDELDFMVWSPFAILSPKKDVLNRKYLKLLLMLPNYVNHIINLGSVNTQVNVGMRDMEKSIIPLTNINNQIKISNFLEKEIRHLDFIKTTIFNQIRTLEDYKKSVITGAVTKGLDKNVEMKDSGIEWIGEIPKHWKLVKGKYIFKQRNSRGNDIDLVLLSPSQKYGVIPQDLYEELSGMRAVKLDLNTNLNNLKTIHVGDFCISLRSFQGGFEYSNYEGVVSPAYQVFYSYIESCNDYYKYMFKERGFIEKMNSFTMSLRDGKNISFSDFANSYIPKPPIGEQQQIAKQLNKFVALTNNAIAAKKKQLETLEEYKKSLIYEYVTGKKEVEDVGTI